jgi:hypothetical protein
MRSLCSMRAHGTVNALGLALALAIPAGAQEVAATHLDVKAFRAMQSSARTVADIVSEAAHRRSRALDTKMRAAGMPPGRAEDQAGGLSLAERSTAEPTDELYDWELVQSWLPDERGIQWCVSGFQSVKPVGGVKLYELSRAYPGPRSLRPRSLVVTLRAQEQVPGPQPWGPPSEAMQHEFDYGTCVSPVFSRVGTYATIASFCGSDRECAENPHISATTLEVRPILVSFDACLDRSAGVVDVFFALLYFDQRPTAGSVRLLFDDAPMEGAAASSDPPWLLVDYTMPLADYESRFGAEGGPVVTSITSDNQFTPENALFFSQSDRLSPCLE